MPLFPHQTSLPNPCNIGFCLYHSTETILTRSSVIKARSTKIKSWGLCFIIPLDIIQLLAVDTPKFSATHLSLIYFLFEGG